MNTHAHKDTHHTPTLSPLKCSQESMKELKREKEVKKKEKDVKNKK